MQAGGIRLTIFYATVISFLDNRSGGQLHELDSPSALLHDAEGRARSWAVLPPPPSLSLLRGLLGRHLQNPGGLRWFWSLYTPRDATPWPCALPARPPTVCNSQTKAKWSRDYFCFLPQFGNFPQKHQWCNIVKALRKAMVCLVFGFAILNMNVPSSFSFFPVNFGGDFYKELGMFENAGERAWTFFKRVDDSYL